MVNWMTTTENRSLLIAQKRGFLVCRREQRTLLDEYSRICSERRLPVLYMDRNGSQYQVVLQWHQGLPNLTLPQQEELRRMLVTPGAPPGLLPIVFRCGAYSAFLEQSQAEKLAYQLAEWIEEQVRIP